jgi:aryl-alcohol dehydrogenase-like predicted oxidoreductase
MEYRRLGSTGMYVSEIAYGNWVTHGSQVEAEAANKCVEAALDVGITTFDTADVYAGTKAETILGKALKGVRRESYELFTKVYHPTGTGKNDRGLSRKHIMESCHASLKRLNTDHIDLLLIHRPDWLAPIDETAKGLNQLLTAGKIRAAGVSNYSASQFEALNSRMDRPLATNQLEFSLLHMDPIYDGTFDHAQQHRYKPMASQCNNKLLWTVFNLLNLFFSLSKKVWRDGMPEKDNAQGSIPFE